jgi:hypothetical protein
MRNSSLKKVTFKPYLCRANPIKAAGDERRVLGEFQCLIADPNLD